ncbi:MAG: hypothetical protein K1000chlam4_00344 [Chlamydiae bacterium]|nr:hypothetical protein [Chlamydiota bacterium]
MKALIADNQLSLGDNLSWIKIISVGFAASFALQFVRLYGYFCPEQHLPASNSLPEYLVLYYEKLFIRSYFLQFISNITICYRCNIVDYILNNLLRKISRQKCLIRNNNLYVFIFFLFKIILVCCFYS